MEHKPHFNTTHGLKNHKLYNIWRTQKKRCLCITNKAYPMYGGRGVIFSDLFLDFKVWFDYVTSLSNYGTDNYTLDRVDNDKGYEVGNLRWASKLTQSRNKRIIMSTNTSGYKGVSWNKKAAKWKVKIVVANKTIHLGYFDDLIEAAKAYNTYVISNNLEHTINDIKE